MRIGIVLSQPPGYSETFFNSKIRGLQEAGITVTLYVQKKNENFKGCPVVVGPKIYRFLPLQLLYMGIVFLSLATNLTSVKRFIRFEREQNTSTGEILKRIFLNAHLLKAKLDWVHFGFATVALGSECVAKAIGAKMAVSLRGFDINIYPLKHPGCYDLLWKKIDKVHSISEYLYKKAVGLGLSEKVQYQIITPAVDMKSLPKSSEATHRTLQIITTARLNWIKGLETAIAAMALLKKDNVRFQYHIIGDGNKKDTERYTFQVYEENLTNEVVFHGKLTHKKTLQLVHDADIYIQPSLNEGFCNAVLEAQAMGKFVLASNVGALPENILDGKTGWLFPAGDAQALVKKIKQVIQFSAKEKENISTQAKQRVAAHFTLVLQQQKFVSFYNQY